MTTQNSYGKPPKFKLYDARLVVAFPSNVYLDNGHKYPLESLARNALHNYDSNMLQRRKMGQVGSVLMFTKCRHNGYY